MKQTRRNKVFETNSSSEHSLSISNEWEIRDLLDDIKYLVSSAEDLDKLYAALGKIEKVKKLILEAIEEN